MGNERRGGGGARYNGRGVWGRMQTKKEGGARWANGWGMHELKGGGAADVGQGGRKGEEEEGVREM